MHPVLCCCTVEHDDVVLQLLYLHRSADELPCSVRSMPLSATATAAATAAAAAPTLPPLRGWGEQRIVLD